MALQARVSQLILIYDQSINQSDVIGTLSKVGVVGGGGDFLELVA